MDIIRRLIFFVFQTPFEESCPSSQPGTSKRQVHSDFTLNITDEVVVPELVGDDAFVAGRLVDNVFNHE